MRDGFEITDKDFVRPSQDSTDPLVLIDYEYACYFHRLVYIFFISPVGLYIFYSPTKSTQSPLGNVEVRKDLFPVSP